MKCPKCSFNSFEFHDTCSKCGKDLTAFKATYNIKALVLPRTQGEAAGYPHPLETGEDMGGAHGSQAATPPPLPLQETAAVFGPDDFAFDSTPIEAAEPSFEIEPTAPSFEIDPAATALETAPAAAALETDAPPATFDLPAEPLPKASPPREAPAPETALPAEPKSATVSTPTARPQESVPRQEGARELSLDDFIHFSDLNASKGKGGESTPSFGKGGFDLDDLFPSDPPKSAQAAAVQQAPAEKEGPEKKGENAPALEWLE